MKLPPWQWGETQNNWSRCPWWAWGRVKSRQGRKWHSVEKHRKSGLSTGSDISPPEKNTGSQEASLRWAWRNRRRMLTHDLPFLNYLWLFHRRADIYLKDRGTKETLFFKLFFLIQAWGKLKSCPSVPIYVGNALENSRYVCVAELNTEKLKNIIPETGQFGIPINCWGGSTHLYKLCISIFPRSWGTVYG